MSERKPFPMWPEETGGEFVIGYMCLTDFECELGAASGGNVVYPSVDDLRANRRCVDGCGIAEVKIIGVRVVQEAKGDDR